MLTQVGDDRVGVKRFDAEAEMIKVAALDPRRFAALGSKRTIDRHKIDQRRAGTKLI